jgi:hypothetical protein
MMALKKLTIYRLDQLRSLSDIFVLTALDCSMIAAATILLGVFSSKERKLKGFAAHALLFG